MARRHVTFVVALLALLLLLVGGWLGRRPIFGYLEQRNLAAARRIVGEYLVDQLGTPLRCGAQRQGCAAPGNQRWGVARANPRRGVAAVRGEQRRRSRGVSPWCFALPNGSRLSCGALTKDSFLNLRAPPASSAC